MSDLLDFILVEAASLSVESTPSSVPSPAAVASPSASAAPARVVGVGVGASGLQGTVSSLKLYSVVSVCASDCSTLCMGVMSKTGQLGFCIKKNCNTKSHQGKKFGLAEDNESFVFIVRVPGSNVFAEPCVKESLVPEMMLKEWRATSTTLPNWVKAFRAVTITEDAEVSAATVGFKETKFLDDAESFRTPFKKRKGGSGDQDKGVEREPMKFVKFSLHERGLPPVSNADELDAIVASGSLGKGGLTRIVSEVESSVITLGEAMEEVTTLTHRRFAENEKDSKSMLGVLQNLFASLGPAVEIDANLEAPTLWGTTAFIAEDVVRLGSVVVNLEAEMKPIMDSIRAVTEAQEKNAVHAISTEKVVQALSLVMGHVRKIGPELNLLKEGLKRLEANVRISEKFGGLREKSPDGGGDSMDKLLTSFKRSARMGEDRLESTPESGDSERRLVDRSGADHASALKMAADICRLMEDVEALKAGAEDSTVKFGGLGIKSLHECHAWINENFDADRYGLLMDPLFMLERIFGMDSLEGTLLKVLESRLKLKIKTGADAAALSALSYARPRQFHNGKVAMMTERNVSRLSKLPNYKSWNSAGQGVRNYVTKQMNAIRGTVAQDISNTFGRGPTASAEAYGLSTMCLNATVTFLTQLLAFVDTLYEKLHVDSRFSPAQSWSLTAQILDRICEELQAPKEGVLETMTIDDPTSICSHIMWATLRTHDIMAGYIDHQFENHPTIAAEYVKFLATNSGHDKVDKLEEEVKEMVDNVATALKSSKTAVSKADVATGKSDSVTKALEALMKRVDKLEKK